MFIHTYIYSYILRKGIGLFLLIRWFSATARPIRNSIRVASNICCLLCKLPKVMPQRFLRYRRIGIKSYQVSIRKNFGAEFGTIMAPSWHHGTSTFSSESQFCGCEHCASMGKSRRFTSCHVLIHRWLVTWSCRPICFQSFLDAGQGISRSWVKVTMSQRSIRSVWLKNKKI